MRYWDSSALIATLVQEPLTEVVVELFDADSVVTWWGTAVECASAIARLERSQVIGVDEANGARRALSELERVWLESPCSERLRERARRLLRIHELRAGDALQLAAAIGVSDDRAESLSFVTLDKRLAVAASLEGFPVLPDQ